MYYKMYYIYSMENKNKITEKQKVINRLVKTGVNPEAANRYANEHYEYASKYYSGVAKIASVIMSL